MTTSAAKANRRADIVERLEGENARLRALLKPFAEMRVYAGDGNDIGERADCPDNLKLAEFTVSEDPGATIGDVRAARRAFEHLPVWVADWWHPIETAPKDGTRVLAWHHEWSAPLTVQFYGDWWGIDSTLPRLLNQPTHWMPLPAPPGVAF